MICNEYPDCGCFDGVCCQMPRKKLMLEVLDDGIWHMATLVEWHETTADVIIYNEIRTVHIDNTKLYV